MKHCSTANFHTALPKAVGAARH